MNLSNAFKKPAQRQNREAEVSRQVWSGASMGGYPNLRSSKEKSNNSFAQAADEDQDSILGKRERDHRNSSIQNAARGGRNQGPDKKRDLKQNEEVKQKPSHNKPQSKQLQQPIDQEGEYIDIPDSVFYEIGRDFNHTQQSNILNIGGNNNMSQSEIIMNSFNKYYNIDGKQILDKLTSLEQQMFLFLNSEASSFLQSQMRERRRNINNDEVRLQEKMQSLGEIQDEKEYINRLTEITKLQIKIEIEEESILIAEFSNHSFFLDRKEKREDITNNLKKLKELNEINESETFRDMYNKSMFVQMKSYQDKQTRFFDGFNYRTNDLVKQKEELDFPEPTDPARFDDQDY